jgi:hypothetical protein
VVAVSQESFVDKLRSKTTAPAPPALPEIGWHPEVEHKEEEGSAIVLLQKRGQFESGRGGLQRVLDEVYTWGAVPFRRKAYSPEALRRLMGAALKECRRRNEIERKQREHREAMKATADAMLRSFDAARELSPGDRE